MAHERSGPAGRWRRFLIAALAAALVLGLTVLLRGVVAEVKAQIKDDDLAAQLPPSTAPPTTAPPGVAPSTTATATPGSSPLPRTGTDIGPLVVLGLGLAAAGAVLTRRRRPAA